MNWPYIAGFFDGEGSITKNPSGFRITIPQTHFKVLDQIRQFTGVGSITKPVKRQSHWRESWTYAISRQEDVLFFLRHVQPYVIVKKNITNTALRRLPTIVERQQQRRSQTKKNIQKVVILRQQGLAYRAIGKMLGIDWGYARRIFLRRTRGR